MKRTLFTTMIAVVACTAVVFAFSADAQAKKLIIFGGGPAGGTFQVVANAIQVYQPVKDLKDYNIKAQSSAGAVENLRKVDSGKMQFGVTYSGAVWKGREGKLTGDTKKYTDVMAVAFLFGAPAQLVVKKDSGIKTTLDLAGKKVGVGNAGSGAFDNCQQFFAHLGIWDKIERNAMGYNDAAQAFGNNQLDAFWLFTAFPSGAVIMAAQTNDIAMIDVQADAENGGYFKAFPYFGKLKIPAGTYRGVDTDIPSFFDSTLWVANTDTPADLVYDLLSIIFTDEGLKHMVSQKKTFKEMSVEGGIQGIATPLHPGAEKFWREKGVLK